MNKLLSFAVLAALLAMAAADCQVSVTQTLGSAWTTNGQDFSQWSVTLTNTGSDGVKSVDLSISNDSLFDQLWNIVKDNRGLYVLPDYVLENGGIAVSGSYQFGYIIKSKAQATIDLEAVDCKTLSPSVAPSTSPAAPSASASPAAASPSSSASPVVVASPQPTGCTVSVESVARSAASGGQWTEGDSQFQIFDVTITNSGNTPVTSVTLTISGVSGADVSIYQFWNLERKDNSDVFTVPTPWGAIQVGASQGAGFIVKSKEGQSAATPVVKVESATCSGSPTAAPSAAPGSPSPSPSPSSPVVATPQPSAAPAGCSAELTIVARSAASGGQWQDGNKWNQIFDVVVTNTGSKALTGGQVSFALASGVSVSQFWELNRKDATTFTIPTTYGPIQVGASQGAGIVATTTTATSIATPTATLSGLTCN